MEGLGCRLARAVIEIEDGRRLQERYRASDHLSGLRRR
jgi:hypothetical protein